MKKLFTRIVGLSALLLASLGAQAQTYPARPVKMVVPFSAGGPADNYARFLAQRLQDILGQNFVVDNKPGAGSVIGTDLAAKAAPDGYTLLVMSNTQTVNESLIPNKPYALMRDFVGVAPINYSDLVLVANPGAGINSIADLIKRAKADPDKLTYASSGSGGSPHLSAETFKIATGTKILHIPYKGGGAAMTDLVSGNVHMIFSSVLETSGFIKSGKLKALAITSKERVSALPDVPTLQEAGVTGAESGSWLGLLAPAGTPKEVIDRISQGLQQAVAAPDIQQLLLGQGAVAKGGSPADFAQLIALDRKRYEKIIVDNKLSAD